MIHYKKVTVRHVRSLKLLAIAAALTVFAFSNCSQAPENCGDGQKLDTHNEFCFEGKAYKKCAGGSYNPNSQFCSADKLYGKCGALDYDPQREFCFGGDSKVYGRCGGGDEYSPLTQGCFFGSVLSKCGVNLYDTASQFCHTDGKIYDKCNGAAFSPETQNCSGSPVYPKCGTESYNIATFSCNNNKVYDKCDGQEYNPAAGCNGVKSKPKCGGGAEYDDTKQFCYNGKLYDKCGGYDYNPSKYGCDGKELVAKSKFTVTVTSAGTGASGGGSYEVGETVTINAGTAPTGHKFKNWTATGGAKLGDASRAATAFVMPPNDVTVTAVFESTTFVDLRDTKTYKLATIGGKVWMAENLNYQPSTSEGNWCYGNNNSNCTKYGRLYTWNVAKTACPSGWHLPTRQEWGNLATSVGGTGTYGANGAAGTKLKAASFGGTDDYGFSALLGGYRYAGTSNFMDIESEGNWWTATENGNGAYRRSMTYGKGEVTENSVGERKDNGMSVRCVKD